MHISMQQEGLELGGSTEMQPVHFVEGRDHLIEGMGDGAADGLAHVTICPHRNRCIQMSGAVPLIQADT